MPFFERRGRIFHFPVQSRYAQSRRAQERFADVSFAKSRQWGTPLLARQVAKFPRGGKERGVKWRPAKLQAQAFWASEFTLRRDTVLATALKLSWGSRFAELLAGDPHASTMLTGPGPFTLFLPVNKAVDAHPVLCDARPSKSTRDQRRLLRLHIVFAHWLWRDLVGSPFMPFASLEDTPRHAPDWLSTAAGKVVDVRHAEGKAGRVVFLGAPTVAGGAADGRSVAAKGGVFGARSFAAPAEILCSDIRCHNGVIHGISRVLHPRGAERTRALAALEK